MLKSSEVFKNSGRAHSLSAQGFYGAIALFVIYGLTGSAVAAHFTLQTTFNPNMWHILILGLAIPIIGIIIAQKSDNWFVSFLGYNMILIPFGVILAPVLREYDEAIIRNALLLTAVITFCMGLAGTLFPNIFSKLGATLFLSLSCLLLVRIAGIFIPQLNDLRIIDYIAAGIFSLYIGFDMWRASQVERTLDSAVDIAVSLYLDIINLFLELMKILGSNDD